jgi:hypothetical protein
MKNKNKSHWTSITLVILSLIIDIVIIAINK